MLLSSEMPENAKYKVYDCLGHQLPYVITYDTETSEIEMAVRIGTDDKGEPIFLAHNFEMEDGNIKPGFFLPKFVLPGAYAEKEGKRI
jgi:hypothetical protein